ncbi:WD40-repeat-containing domain protein [Lipomyces japonicus]|uniref:WD40-repeat-containing domain protein n=1 Tax=Lipomyces japonicus TaxID=56871 RepID=UPI0034CDFDD2
MESSTPDSHHGSYSHFDDTLNFVNFNQDFSCISVGTKHGYKIYNCDPFGKCFYKADGGIAIVEMLFCTSLVALVGIGDQPALSPRRLHITNTKRQSTICELTFPTSVLAVKLNRRRLIVVLEEQIYVYDISNMKLLHTIETSPNPNAICALSPSSENCYIAYPSPSSATTAAAASSPISPTFPASFQAGTGDVLIFDALSLQPLNVIEAHKAPLSCVSLNQDGTLLASASDTGTIVRVFSVPGGQKLYQFRRGSYPSRIYSITFNNASSLLCVSSATETVHIFKLSEAEEDQQISSDDGRRKSLSSSVGSESGSSPTGISGGIFDTMMDGKTRNGAMRNLIRRSSQTIGRSVAGRVGGYLPTAVTEMWEPARDFAFVKLPNKGLKSVVALSPTSSHVIVVTSEGYFYQYGIDLEKGGECTLIKKYSLLENGEELTQSLIAD